MTYATHFSTRATPQLEPIPGKTQVQNNAGGFVFQVDDWARLDRFLMLGNEGGSYYASEKAMTIENAQVVLRCAAADPSRTVARIVEISEAGRAPKNDPAIFALAICAKIPEALDAMPRVCRTGTHLFQWIEAVEKFRGHGRALNRCLRNWYLQKAPEQVAYQVVKYQQRNSWSHRDVLRLCKPKNTSEALNSIFKWVVGKAAEIPNVPAIIAAFEAAKKATDSKEIAKLIYEHDLPREAVPTQFLNDVAVWEALLVKMPLTATIRNLAKMTAVGLLAPMSAACSKVVAELGNHERLKKARIHPVAVLNALRTYASGHGEKGKLTWTPIPQITDALDEAFYASFAAVEPTGKRWYLGCDVSGSMWGSRIAGTSLTAAEATAALALVTAAVESNYCLATFNTSMVPFNFSPRVRLDAAMQQMQALPWGGTDCSLPMLDAMTRKIPVDVFTVFTDNETWAGNVHPCQALVKYREQTGIPAKLIVVGMTAKGFSIADPSDGGMMDIVGFDTAVPQIMADFAQ